MATPARGSCRLRAAVAAAALVLAAGAPAAAQSADGEGADSLRALYRLPAPRMDVALAHATPAMSANSPSAFGARWGDVFVGASFTARARYVDAHDGAVGAGFGLGDPERWVGLEVDLISFSTFRSHFGRRMGVDFKLHRWLPGQFGVALGWESAILRGVTDGQSSHYAVVSKWLPLAPDGGASRALMLSLGVGDGRFRSEQDVWAGRKTVNVFGSAALRVARPASVILDWTGQDLTAGVSLAPFRKWQMVVTPGVADITGHAGDGPRFVISAGWGLDFTGRS